MILNGSQRGGGQNLASHLLKEENDHIELYDLRGFISDDLHGAFKEAHALSRNTKCDQYLYSLSLNPPKQEAVSTDLFKQTIDRVESKLGLKGQPRAIVFHEKDGRRHCHVVWSRIDAETMTARQLSFSKLKLREISRELYLENGWKIPRGLMNSQERDLNNFTLAEWQQAKRAMRAPREVTSAIRESWSISDSRTSFANALKERGYILARGDRRGFVAVDYHGEVHAITRKIGLKAKDVRQKLGSPEHLLDTREATAQLTAELAPQLKRMIEHQLSLRNSLKDNHKQARNNLVNQQKRERAALDKRQTARSTQEAKLRAHRFRHGMLGLWDRVRGRHAQIKRRNEQDTWDNLVRDRREKDQLIFQQLETRKAQKEIHTFALNKQRKDFREIKRDYQENQIQKRNASKDIQQHLHRQAQQKHEPKLER